MILTHYVVRKKDTLNILTLTCNSNPLDTVLFLNIVEYRECKHLKLRYVVKSGY